MDISSDSSFSDLEQNSEMEPVVASVEESSVKKTDDGGGAFRQEMSAAFQQFVDKFSALPTPEEKIAFGLQFMRSSISQEGSPRFREFWEARKWLLPRFKENINPAIRSTLWAEYVELTVEARRLKEILEEQSAFAMEQIDLAIQALEKDVENLETLLGQAEEVNFPQNCQTVRQKSATYNAVQSELNFLNTLASRLNGLRKEILKTEMRVRFKTKFFKRLSELGDHIFPKRKELIAEVSAEFEKDVESFVSKHFKDGQIVGAPYYVLREEIKALQGMSKVLTLSSGGFSRTRLKLSECWDQVKAVEKEHKKEVNLKKQASSELCQQFVAKIEEIAPKAAEMELSAVDEAIEVISQEMRSADLHRDDVRYLRDSLAKLRAPHLEALEQKAREIEMIEKEKQRLKKEQVVELKAQIADLIRDGANLEMEALVSAFAEVKQKLEKLETSKMEKQQIERSLRPLKDLVADKKENSLLHLTDDQRQNLENLRTVLLQKKQRRQEIKDQITTSRNALGSSGLDFEKAMLYREQADQEKDLLDKANASIEEIEKKISEIEG
ncbi:MAG TPA: hypothetical protein DCE71_02810 [Parachlamydiales bacterium]|nr:hypothetical protein [Parachlamydiales bacterium]